VERNRLDLELYEYGRALFHQRCDRANQASQSPEGVTPPRSGQTEPTRFVPFPARPAPERAATIHRVTAVWEGGAASRTLEIVIKFRTKERIDDLVAGVSIYDADGESVYGNRPIIDRQTLQNAPDRDCYAAFILDCSLPPGTYAVTVGLAHPRRLGFHYHWIDGAATFEVPAGAPSSGEHTVCLRRFESGMDPAVAPDHVVTKA
jgi:hypothetical protein